jgi:hypothetical protein
VPPQARRYTGRRPRSPPLARIATALPLARAPPPSQTASPPRRVNDAPWDFTWRGVLAAPPAGFEPATHGLGTSPGVCRQAHLVQRRWSWACPRTRSSVLHTQFRRRDGQLDGQLSEPPTRSSGCRGGVVRGRGWARPCHTSRRCRASVLRERRSRNRRLRSDPTAARPDDQLRSRHSGDARCSPHDLPILEWAGRSGSATPNRLLPSGSARLRARRPPQRWRGPPPG